MTADRLTELRAELARQGLDGFIVPRADGQLGVYVEDSAERLSWFSGCTGKARMTAVTVALGARWQDGGDVSDW